MVWVQQESIPASLYAAQCGWAPEVLGLGTHRRRMDGGPRESAWHKDQRPAVNAVSLMLTETSHSVTVSYDESTWSVCCLLGVASHTGPCLPAQNGGAGPDRAPQPLAATWLIAAIPDLGWVGPWRDGLEGREGQLDSYRGVTLLQGPEPSAALSTGLLSLIHSAGVLPFGQGPGSLVFSSRFGQLLGTSVTKPVHFP